MSIITPVGGIIGPRPTGASFRTGVWKQPEVYERRVDGVWATPAYPDLAPYATNASGEILAAVFDPNYTATNAPSTYTTSYIKPRVKFTNEDVSLDPSRAAYVSAQAVSADWRFTLRYWDEPDGSNVFGLTPQVSNVQRIALDNGNYIGSSWGYNSEYGFGFYTNFALINTIAWADYVYRNYSPERDITSSINKESGKIAYYTSYSTSTARWPFGQATNYVGNYAGYNLYRSYSTTDKHVALWLLPP